MLSNNQQISFTQNINIVSLRRFNSLVRDLPRRNMVGSPWRFDTSQLGDNLFTRGIFSCVAGAVTSRKGSAMFHLNCEEYNFKNMRVLTNQLRPIYRGTRRFSCLLVGAKPPDVMLVDKSIKLFDAVHKNLAHLNLSYFKGQKNPFQCTSIFHSPSKNTVYMNILRDAQNAESSVESASALIEAYKDIYIAQGDRLFISDKPI